MSTQTQTTTQNSQNSSSSNGRIGNPDASAAPEGRQESVGSAPAEDTGTGLLDISANGKSRKGKSGRIGNTSGTSKAARAAKSWMGKASKMTVGGAIDAVASKTESATAQTTSALRGITEGTLGTVAGVGKGLLKGSRGLLGHEKAFLASLANEDHSPIRVGHVASVKMSHGTPVMQLELERKLNGAELESEGTVTTEPTAFDSYSYERVRFDGEAYEAMCIRLKAENEHGRSEVVGFLFIDDRDGGEGAPVYLVPLADG